MESYCGLSVWIELKKIVSEIYNLCGDPHKRHVFYLFIAEFCFTLFLLCNGGHQTSPIYNLQLTINHYSYKLCLHQSSLEKNCQFLTISAKSLKWLCFQSGQSKRLKMTVRLTLRLIPRLTIITTKVYVSPVCRIGSSVRKGQISLKTPDKKT